MMYPLDMVSSLTGLSEKQIYRLEKEGVINPQHKSGMKYYSLQDIDALKSIATACRKQIVESVTLGSEVELTRQKFENFSACLKERKAALKKNGHPISAEEIHSLLYG